MDPNLLQYVVLQLLVLAGSLDENLSKDQQVAPLRYAVALTPTNLPALIADARSRLAGATLSGTYSNPPAVPTANPPAIQVAAPQAPASVSPPAHTPVVSVSPQTAPVNTTPAAAAQPQNAPRHKRSVDSQMGEFISTYVPDVYQQYIEHPDAVATGVQAFADSISDSLSGSEFAAEELFPSHGFGKSLLALARAHRQRRKRDVADVLAETLDVVSDVAGNVAKTPIAVASGVAPIADLVSGVADVIDSHIDNESTPTPVAIVDSSPPVVSSESAPA